MARPRKQPHERRSQSVRSDLTLAEKAYVQEQASLAGLSEAEYTRRRVLDYAVKSRAGTVACDPSLVTEINRLGLQLSAVGNLANQIALYCHTDRRLSPDWYELPSQINDLLRLVQRSLEKSLADDGA